MERFVARSPDAGAGTYFFRPKSRQRPWKINGSCGLPTPPGLLVGEKNTKG
jgi:hypothetical protein